MATGTVASKSARQLGEFLQERQEPFILEVYLSERGYVKKNSSSGDNFMGCHGNSCKFLKKSGSLNKSKQGMPQFPKVLKVILCNKFFRIKGFKGSRPKNSDDEDGKLSVTTEMDINNQETAEEDRFSSASSATVYHSCPDSDVEDEPPVFADNSVSDLGIKVVEDTKFEWNCMEEHKHSSPQSVLVQVSTPTSSPLDNSRQVSKKRLFWSKLMKVDSIFSAWFLNLLLQTRAEKSSCAAAGVKELQVPDWSNSSRSSKSKRVLRQTKQLFFDRIREWVEEGHDKKVKGKSFKGYDDVIRKVGFENIKGWGKQYGEESNIKQLLELDIISSTREWKNDFESEKTDIGLVTTNAIMEEIISEVIKDTINVL